ncbi:EAL domain-containing protein [Cohnella hashimotonis]|uniref:EAL domain-containing protein n=1 Tax=Cohnella hashimotonis TaxID=2826895 RepID=A0ABT6TL00_9BACL|nr:EAL domain-containing protein [Cohnella hashimotonis]MDI4647541.1 EAL domain-containing protein [Cohnella hashimotonis]
MLTRQAFERQAPLRDSGYVEFRADSDAGAARTLTELLGPPGDAGYWSVRYDHYQQLLQMLNAADRKLTDAQKQTVECRIFYEEPLETSAQDESDGWVQAARLLTGFGSHRVVDYIANRRFSSYMQPIVQLSGKPIGYEMLLRPLPEQPPFRPSELFEAAREAGLHSFLDREARNSAIRVASRQLPAGVKKFINFLPSSIYRPDQCLQQTFERIIMSGMDPADFVFEVVETERLDDVRHLNKVFAAYRNMGIRLAMDDLGDEFATVEAMEQLQPDYIKLDRKWVAGCDGDSDKQRRIEDVLERASRFHGVVLAEGVEREEEWQYLREAGVPLMQGYLFGRPSPVPMPVRFERAASTVSV